MTATLFKKCLLHSRTLKKLFSWIFTIHCWPFRVTFSQASVYENPPGNLMTMWHNWESLSFSEYFAFNNPQGLFSVLRRKDSLLEEFGGARFMLQSWGDLRVKTLQNLPASDPCLFVRTHITAHAATSGWSIFCSVCTALCTCISKDLLMVYLWRSSL